MIPRGIVKKKRTHLYKKKKKNPVFWLLPFENCSTWLFRKSEVTYVLNIVSNNKSKHSQALDLVAVLNIRYNYSHVSQLVRIFVKRIMSLID